MDIQDTIDAYVKGQLTGAERTSFEKKMESDPALAEAVAQARFDLEAANLLLRDELREWMQHWKEDDLPASPVFPPEPSVSPHATRRRFYWFLAAIAVLAALAAFWFLTQKQSTLDPVSPAEKTEPAPETKTNFSPDQPVAQETTQQKNTPPHRRLPPSPSQPIAMAREQYRNLPAESFIRGNEPARPSQKHALNDAATELANANYARVIELAQTVPASDERYADAQVLLGQVYFQQKQYERAEKAIRAALATEKIDPDQAQWNLLMTLLAQYPAKRTAFEALLEEILQDEGHGFYKAAKALKAALK